MKLYIFCIIVLIISRESQGQTDLSELIEKQQGSRIQRLVLHSGEYNLHNTVVISDVEEFSLVGNNKTIVKCIENASIPRNYMYSLEFRNVSHISFEGIIFRDCNQHIKVKDPPSQTEGYFFFKKCKSVRVHNCTFQNIKGVNILCYNTLKLKVTDSIFRNTRFPLAPSKAMLLYVNETEKQFTSLEVRRSLFKGEEWQSGYNAENDHANFAVKCGSAISVFILTEVDASVQIVDNEFIENKATHGGAICMWISEDVNPPKIHIERGNFVGGQANTLTSEEKYHERPGGGAIALFLFTRGTKLVISHCNFTNNIGYRGGAVYLDFSLTPNETQIDNCIFEKNSAKLGGAMMVTTALIPDQVYITITNTSFTGNKAREFGGAILAQRVSISMRDNNIVTHNEAVEGDGGGMGLVYSHILVNGTFKVVNNVATRAGGGVYMSSQAKFTMGRHGSLLNISRNIAKMWGGGLFAYSQNYEYTYIEKIIRSKQNFRRACFLRGVRDSTIIMKGNKVENNNKACAGNDAYTHLLGKCLRDDIVGGTFLIEREDCDKDTRENSFELEIDSIISIKCNKSLFNVDWTYDHSYSVNILKYCQMKGDVVPFTQREAQIPLTMIKTFHKLHKDIDQFYYVYPGYTTTLNVSSRDYFNYSVVTHANVSARIYSDGKKHKLLRTNHIEFEVSSDAYQSVSLLTNVSISATLKSEWFGLGVMCVKSIGGYTRIEKCIGIIMGKCPPGFRQKRKTCVCSTTPWYSCNSKNQVIVHPGLYMANKYSFNDSRIGMHQAVCLWFRCKCHFGASQNTCTFDPMKPDEQCHFGLKGTLCGQCSNPNQTLLHSPLLSSINVYTNCFDCTRPMWKIAGAVGILVGISLAIIILRINFLDDYLRSIIFFANILYVILTNSNLYVNPILNKGLVLPVLLLNLLVTQLLEFCIYSKNNQILVVMFDMIVPWSVLVIFIIVQLFLTRRFSYLSTRDVPKQIWSMLLLTYTDLLIHSIMILNCPKIIKTRYWLYDGSTICFENMHLNATLISFFVIFVLISIPCFLLFIIYCTKNFKFIEYITNNFKRKFRFWEIYKLFLRWFISLILSLDNYIDPNISRTAVCLICLTTMIINSRIEPANNVRTNYFESFCFLCLGYIVIQQKSVFTNYVAPLPLIVGLIAYIIDKKIPLWWAKKAKITEKWSWELSFKEKLGMLWSIWDSDNIFTLKDL